MINNNNKPITLKKGVRMEKPDLLVSEVARHAECHINTVLAYDHKGVIKSTRDINNRRRFTLAEAEKLKSLLFARWADQAK